MNSSMFNWQLALLASTVLLVSICGQGQNRWQCTLRGTLQDEWGNPVPHAMVTVESTEQQSVELGTRTDEEGRFELSLPRGSYRFLIRVEAKRFLFPFELKDFKKDTTFTWVISPASGLY